MIQVWTINILIMRSRLKTVKSKNWQKHHRTKEPKDQNQSGQNPPKWENILILQQSRCTIKWSHDTGVDNQHLVMWSRGRTEKSKNGQKRHRTKEPKGQNQSGQNQQKWKSILILQQSRCTMPWSHDTGVYNQHSRYAITWADREKQKWTKAP